MYLRTYFPYLKFLLIRHLKFRVRCVCVERERRGGGDRDLSFKKIFFLGDGEIALKVLAIQEWGLEFWPPRTINAGWVQWPACKSSIQKAEMGFPRANCLARLVKMVSFMFNWDPNSVNKVESNWRKLPMSTSDLHTRVYPHNHGITHMRPNPFMHACTLHTHTHVFFF